MAALRVFFGHQSVGANILDGVRQLDPSWTIVEWGPSVSLSGSGEPAPAQFLLHAKVGRNEDPISKCADFRRLIDEELSGQVDVALLKFCYIDINERTDVDALLDQYRSTIDDLARRHPSVTFVPVTAPLRHAAGGAGVWAREMLGRPNRIKLANARRHAFNTRLRQAYAGRPIFDLAASESTRPDGSRATFRHDDTTCENLVGAYTDDGGHLNAEGRAKVARDFLSCLARARR